ncbi:hypothetical protein [uncultured Sphingomonas sp.]|uniref:hypothetical protein n=1 Tax=uncultured Sphingomonas sp. TaxID=158754 RepID=UPI0025E1590D|nr:hypothetical protein [uncultured Sphingomonas sp.]
MIVNITYLNASNGMFWYAIDKMKTINTNPTTVLVSPRLAPLVRRELPHFQVREISKVKAAYFIIFKKLLQRSSERVVAFTSHPLPFVRDQTIAFHDDYPFIGQIGRVKRALFILAAWTSGCRVGIVNRSLAIPFLTACGIGVDRIFFDSAFPAVDLREATPRSPIPGTPLRIGLVGTDSRKKNYHELFSATVALEHEREVRFELYGTDNEYVRELRADFPTINLTVVSSDDIGPIAFFDKIDYLVSVARAEGYGRPMGLAAALGVPLFLLRSPVFLEFFGEHAIFFDDGVALLRHIVDVRPPAVATAPRLAQAVPERSPFFA